MTFPQGTYRSLNYLGKEKEKKKKNLRGQATLEKSTKLL